jgi:hypothetical protein
VIDHRDILERLADFDHYGNTATERFEMRMQAYIEIKKLREQTHNLLKLASKGSDNSD